MKKLLPLLLLVCSGVMQAQTNNALNLNGTSNFVSIGAPIPANSSYTKEAWVIHTGTIGFRNIISSLNHPFWVDNGRLKGGNGGNYGYVTDPEVFPMNRWVHVALTFDATTNQMVLYRDGQVVDNIGGVPQITSEATYISSHQGGQNFWSGMIDEVRIWSVVLTRDQIRRNMLRGVPANSPGLLAYYQCNQSGGTVLTNSCTNPGAVNGTMSAGTGFAASPIQLRGNALHFDGIDDYVTLGNRAILRPAAAVTIELWARSANWAVGAQQQLTSNFENGGYGLTLSGGNLNFAVLRSGSGSYEFASIPQSTLTNNQWHHIAGVFDGLNIRLYVNGVQVALNYIGPTNRTITYSYANHLLIGAEATSGSGTDGMHFQGDIDEVRIWNVARTAAQIQDAMNIELNPEDATQTNGLVSYYTFNQGTGSGNNTGLTGVTDLKGVNTATLINFALTGATSNYSDQRTGLILLPVVLKDFNATAVKDGVSLDWTTAQEQNSASFDIEHSGDGTAWKKIGSVTAAGYSATARSYRFIHDHPLTGSNYYRLAQIDADGKKTYSSVKRLVFTARQKDIILLGNMVVNNRLSITVNKATTVSIFGTDGKLYLKKSVGIGSQILYPDLPSAGMYWLTDGTQIEKIIVQ